ncbi:hypothetical protein KIN20_003196 [Parelaphostrongylus tenuis]|uniref:Uncharacterized protein n=1 Tax=Parelaphostrongylus tenuis TaxID=148309 RepID=A0AAD5LYS8_PARTN|nr:hypothetical protein KIN20_003196 [Parelaphostrongylus tenuis]
MSELQVEVLPIPPSPQPFYKQQDPKEKMILDRLRNANPNNVYVMESFDVTALYTNVSNDSALQATHELLMQHQGGVKMLLNETSEYIRFTREIPKDNWPPFLNVQRNLARTAT